MVVPGNWVHATQAGPIEKPPSKPLRGPKVPRTFRIVELTLIVYAASGSAPEVGVNETRFAVVA